jgi:hypothetical protein
MIANDVFRDQPNVMLMIALVVILILVLPKSCNPHFVSKNREA